MGKASRKKKTLTKTKADSSTKKRIGLQPKSDIPAASGFLYKPFFHIFLIVTLTLLAYSNTFQSSFHFDDYDYIVDNLKLKNLSNFWPPAGSRWVGYLTFALNYRFGGLNVTGYHVVNIIIHIINALLVYQLVLLIFKTPFFRALKRQSVRVSESQSFDTLMLGHFDTKFVALFSALIFVSHPIQTQAVTYITQRFASLATMFYLLSLVLYVKWRIQSKRPSTETCIGKSEFRSQSKTKTLSSKLLTLNSIFLYLTSVFSAVLAMKTKEIAFTLPIIIILYEFFFNLKLETRNLKRFLFLLPFLLTLVIIPLNFIGHEQEITESALDSAENLRQYQLKDLAVLSKYEYLITQFRVIVTYIRLLFFPVNQNLDYDYPVYNSFFNPNVFLSFLFLLFIFGVGVYLFYCSKQHPPVSPLSKGRIEGGCTLFTIHCSRLTAFGIFWFFITLSVESSIIPIKDVIFEHRVYLPSIGFFIAVGTFSLMVIEKLRNKWRHTDRMVLGLFILIIIVLTGATYMRNKIWKEELSLWKDVTLKSPEKAGGHNSLGNAYLAERLFSEAIEQYEIVIELKPNVPESYVNLGNAYQSQGQIDSAIEQYLIAVKLNPEQVVAHNNICNAYYSRGLLDKATEHCNIALKIKPDFAKAHNNLGNIYKLQGMLDKAIEQYLQTIKFNPDSSDAYYNLGNAYSAKNLLDKAIEQHEIAIKLNPDFLSAHNNLGNDYLLQGQIDKAIEQFLIAVRINPKVPEVYYNLGDAYKAQGRIDNAVENFQTAISLKPGWEMPHFDLGRIYFEKGNMEKARIEFEETVRINPRNQKAQKFLNLINQKK